MLIKEFIRFFALIMLMLVTGIFWGPWFSLHRSMKVFSKEEFIKIVRVMSANLAMPMRIMMPACILLMSFSFWTYSQRDSIGFYLNLMALLLIIISLVI